MHVSVASLASLKTSLRALTGLIVHRPPSPQPPSPIFQPNLGGIVYQGHDYAQAWRYKNAMVSASPPTGRAGWAPATVKIYPKRTEHGVATAQELEQRFEKAAKDPEVHKMLEQASSMPEPEEEVVVGDETVKDLFREGGRARTELYRINPQEVLSDAISDALFKGLTWDAMQGQRSKLQLFPRMFPYKKDGKPHRLVGGTECCVVSPC